MKKELFKFQQNALNSVKDKQNALLCWGMGISKTVSSIALAEYWGSEIFGLFSIEIYIKPMD